MAIRSGMAAIVAALRRDIGNPATSVFIDDDLQGFLDERACDVTGFLLTADAVLAGGPATFRARGWWEDTAVVTNGAGSVLTADGTASDPLRGIWAFTSAPGVDVYVTGRYFDYWGSAANALEAWAARVATEFDFAPARGVSFNRTGKREGLLAVAREYGRRVTRC